MELYIKITFLKLLHFLKTILEKIDLHEENYSETRTERKKNNLEKSN